MGQLEEALAFVFEPAFAVTEDGVILAANQPMGSLLGLPPAALTGHSLLDYVDTPAERATSYLRRCAGSRSPMPGALSVHHQADGGCTLLECRCDGAAVATSQGPAIILRLRPRAEGAASFVVLNERIGDLTREILLRRKAEEELRALNETLETRVVGRTAELETSNALLAAEIDERKRAEAHVQQLQRMEAVGHLTGGVAHDFNNLLAAIIGNLELVEMRLADDTLLKMVQAACRAAQRGAKLTEQLLVFARMHHLAPTAVDLNRTVIEVVEMLRRTLGAGIDISTSFADPLDPAFVDPTQLETAIVNLAINARDAMPDGGALSFETRNLCVESYDAELDLLPGDYVVVIVRDTGEGMPDEIVARAFEPFYTTKPVGKGSGLGLSQVYGLAKQSRGAVRIASKPAQGTVVSLLLPRAVTDPLAEAEPVAALLEHQRGTVLVVDDQDDVREVAVAHLEFLGYDAIQACNGRSALELIETSRKIDLLIVDYAMPDMTGAEVSRAMRARRPDLPVLLLTGYADADALNKGLKGTLLLKKPYRLQELAATVDAALRWRPLAAPQAVAAHNRR